jgi:hypothetical protein
MLEAWREAMKYAGSNAIPLVALREKEDSGATLLRFPFLRRLPDGGKASTIILHAQRIRHIPPGRLDPGTIEYDLVVNAISRMIGDNLPSRLVVAFMTEFGLVPPNLSSPYSLVEMTDREKDIAIARYRMALRRILHTRAPAAQIESSMGFLEQSGVGKPGPNFERVVGNMLATVSGEHVPDIAM